MAAVTLDRLHIKTINTYPLPDTDTVTAFRHSQEYGVNFFKGFTLVLNALDNRAARNHVNRMCLAAHVPLVESGTAGYLGQVTVSTAPPLRGLSSGSWGRDSNRVITVEYSYVHGYCLYEVCFVFVSFFSSVFSDRCFELYAQQCGQIQGVSG